MEIRRDVFQAIADPTRRDIIDMLSREPLNLNGIAERFPISRPAISKHIRILNECGLLKIKQVGRERICQPDFKKLKEVSTWAEKYSRFWDSKLDGLQDFLAGEK